MEEKRKVYGYCRISSPSQSITRQIVNIIRAYPNAKIVEETYTGRTSARPKYQWLLKIVKSGDTIVFDEVSRMSRNAEEGFKTYQKLYNKGVNLVFLKEPQIGTDRYRENMQKRIDKIKMDDRATGKFVNAVIEDMQEYMWDLARDQIADAFARSQAEVDYLHQRTKEGIAEAKAAGHIPGRRNGQRVNTRRGLECKEVMLKTARAFGGNMKDVDLIKLMSCGRKSYYKWKRELMPELDAGKSKEEIIDMMKNAAEKIEAGYEKKGRE